MTDDALMIRCELSADVFWSVRHPAAFMAVRIVWNALTHVFWDT